MEDKKRSGLGWGVFTVEKVDFGDIIYSEKCVLEARAWRIRK